MVNTPIKIMNKIIKDHRIEAGHWIQLFPCVHVEYVCGWVVGSNEVNGWMSRFYQVNLTGGIDIWMSLKICAKIMWANKKKKGWIGSPDNQTFFGK